MQTIKLECLATANKVTAVIVIVIVIVNLYIYIAPLKKKLLRGTPDPTKPNHDQKGWSSDGCGREAETARSSERRRLGKAFQKDGPTTAKLLRWALASLTLGTTRSPCSAERRDLWPGKDDIGTQSSLR